jgi:glycosyltransferase involved in cell wall biosynthesis
LAKQKIDNTPLVSVLVPTHNRAGTVMKAIDSILRQSHQKLEVIVVDDGSTDNTSQVVKDAQSKDARVFYYHNTGQKGCAGARMMGITKLSGEYVAFLDDDDLYAPDKILMQLEAFSCHPEADVVVSGVPDRWCAEGNQGLGWIQLEFHPNRIFNGCVILCKRTVLEVVATRWGYMEWRDFAFQVYENDFAVYLSSEHLVQINDSTASMSKHQEQMLSAALLNAKTYDERSRGREGHEVFVHYLANCHRNWGEPQSETWGGVGGHSKFHGRVSG